MTLIFNDTSLKRWYVIKLSRQDFFLTFSKAFLTFPGEKPNHIYIFNDTLSFYLVNNLVGLVLPPTSFSCFSLLPVYVALPLPPFPRLCLYRTPFLICFFLPVLCICVWFFIVGLHSKVFCTSNSLRLVSILGTKCQTPNFCLSFPKALEFKPNSWKKLQKSRTLFCKHFHTCVT